jgi:hypothetical protein
VQGWRLTPPLNISKQARLPRMEMQGERNNRTFAGDIEFPASQFSFDIYTSPDLLRTSHCLDPTVALACG